MVGRDNKETGGSSTIDVSSLYFLHASDNVFVGDSLNRNQWTSLLCLIESSLHPSSHKFVVRNDNLFVFNETVGISLLVSSKY